VGTTGKRERERERAIISLVKERLLLWDKINEEPENKILRGLKKCKSN
jgi:hypothetical protein